MNSLPFETPTSTTPHIPWWFTRFSSDQIEAVSQAISGGQISQGRINDEFEDQFKNLIGSRHAVSTTSGSTALFLALLALDIRPGDEVIVPARTWIATAHAASLLGAQVRLVDVEARLPRLDLELVQQAITPKTRAILPVHLNGRGVDIEKLKKICSPHGISIVEDACQAYRSKFGETYLGTQGEIACFSLGMTKLITAGQGGVLTTQRDDLLEKLRSLRCHGIQGSVHTPHFQQVGGNFRFTDLQASFVKTQLEHIEKREQRLRQLYDDYQNMLSEFPFLELLAVDKKNGELPLYIEAVAQNREKLITHLESFNIETRPFLPCLSSAPYLNSNGSYPNSSHFSNNGLYLPSGPDQPGNLIERLYDALKCYQA